MPPTTTTALENVIPDSDSNTSVQLDPAVLSYFPKGTTVLSASTYGTSLWSRVAKITTKDAKGQVVDYFLKVATGDNGRHMMYGEFEAMKAIKAVTPEFCPTPYTCGTYQNIPDTHFFLCEFVEMGQSPPPAARFCRTLAKLHRESKSPNGKFGFWTTTCNGNVPQDNGWSDSWEEFFTRGFKHMVKQFHERAGKDDELDQILIPFYEKVIPRLLRPLETGGRKIKPSLVHGDLWYGNTALTVESRVPMVFDSCAFYAHNEYELGNWRPVRNQFSALYYKEYLSNIPKSEPEEDFDDRNLLYSTRFNLHASILFPGMSRYRDMVVDSIKELNAKFAK